MDLIDQVFQNQNQKQVYYQEGFYTNKEFFLMNKVEDNKQ